MHFFFLLSQRGGDIYGQTGHVSHSLGSTGASGAGQGGRVEAAVVLLSNGTPWANTSSHPGDLGPPHCMPRMLLYPSACNVHSYLPNDLSLQSQQHYKMPLAVCRVTSEITPLPRVQSCPTPSWLTPNPICPQHSKIPHTQMWNDIAKKTPPSNAKLTSVNASQSMIHLNLCIIYQLPKPIYDIEFHKLSSDLTWVILQFLDLQSLQCGLRFGL